ncbi:MAG: CopG family transcriptional regulator [Lachnospiraceae bacterium]|nr:CopG family transcriptional regulator [Lachnospiraceae bacterium]
MDGKLIISRKPAKGEDGYKTFSVRIRDETVAKLNTLADKSGRSRNELIGILLEYALQNCSIEEKHAKKK